MAREHAFVKISIWGDPDWREVPADGKLLYFTLLTAPSLTHCGVFDWRPARLATLIGWPVDQLRAAAQSLVDRMFVVLDDATEEGLIRTFVRNDGLLKQPTMGVSVAKAYAGTVSTLLRGVIVHELVRLHHERPDLAGWSKPQAKGLLDMPTIDPRTGHVTGSETGDVRGSVRGSVTPDEPVGEGLVQGFGQGSPTTATATAPYSSSSATQQTSSVGPTPAKTKGSRIPEGWQPSADDLSWAAEKHPGVNVEAETEKFRDYWHSKSGQTATKVDWTATWRNWIRKSVEFSQQRSPTRTPDRGPRVYPSRRPGILPQEYS